MSRENQQTISAWANETFGPPKQIYARVTRMNLEWAEFLQSWNNKTPDAVELADTSIVLMHTAQAFGVDTNLIFYPSVWYGTDEELPLLVRRTSNIMAKLLEYSMLEDDAHIRGELMRMAVALREIAYKLGHRLPELIDDKMVINRARQWARAENGYNKHVG